MVARTREKRKSSRHFGSHPGIPVDRPVVRAATPADEYGDPSMTAFDFAPLLPAGLPAAGGAMDRARRNTISSAATTTPTKSAARRPDRGGRPVLQREGRIACDLRAEQRTAGLPAAARIPRRQAQARCRHRLHRRRHPDHVGLAAGARPGQRRCCSRAATP